jgi:hypothetical protein
MVVRLIASEMSEYMDKSVIQVFTPSDTSPVIQAVLFCAGLKDASDCKQGFGRDNINSVRRITMKPATLSLDHRRVRSHAGDNSSQGGAFFSAPSILPGSFFFAANSFWPS